MSFVMKSWLNRVTQFPTRRKLTIESQSVSEIVCTVERAEGTVTTEGDAITAEALNDLENRINDGFDEKADAVGSIRAITHRLQYTTLNISGGASAVTENVSIPSLLNAGEKAVAVINMHNISDALNVYRKVIGANGDTISLGIKNVSSSSVSTSYMDIVILAVKEV